MLKLNILRKNKETLICRNNNANLINEKPHIRTDIYTLHHNIQNLKKRGIINALYRKLHYRNLSIRDINRISTHENNAVNRNNKGSVGKNVPISYVKDI